jgi:hypothetical protein
MTPILAIAFFFAVWLGYDLWRFLHGPLVLF